MTRDSPADGEFELYICSTRAIATAEFNRTELGPDLAQNSELSQIIADNGEASGAIELTPMLPPEWPTWSDTAFVLGLGVLAGSVPAINERAGQLQTAIAQAAMPTPVAEKAMGAGIG